MVISGLKSSENSLVMITRTTDFSEHPQFVRVCCFFFWVSIKESSMQ